MASVLEAALARARGGEPVLPIWWTDKAGSCQCPKKTDCSSPGKHPLTKHGLDDATRDEGTLRTWFTKWSKANLAVRTDLRPRFDVDLVEVAETLPEDVAPSINGCCHPPRLLSALLSDAVWSPW